MLEWLYYRRCLEQLSFNATIAIAVKNGTSASPIMSTESKDWQELKGCHMIGRDLKLSYKTVCLSEKTDIVVTQMGLWEIRAP